MTTHWKPSTRETFAAYVCDDAALEALRPIVAEMGWQAEKCHKGGLRNAVQSLSISASPSILMVDLSECGDPLSDINALAEVCEPGTLVIAIGQVNDVRLYRDLVSSGLHDYLLKPLSADPLRDALAHAQAVLNAPKTDGLTVNQHISTTVIGTRGGCGASLLATSLAWLFSTEHKRPTALFDLDVHFGTGALTLDLEPGRGLTDAIDNPSRIDGLFIERAMIRANDNLAILSAEAAIHMPLMTDGAAFVQLEEEFRQAFEMTVVDLPRHMLINYPQTMGDANVVVLVTELTLAGARDAIRLLSWLKSHAGQARVIVVANKVQPGAGEITKADFEASIEKKIDFIVPYDFKAAANAAKLGQTFCEANHPTRAAAVIRDIAKAVVRAGDQDTGNAAKPADGDKKSRLPRFDIKALLPSRKTKAPAQ